jgi:hypothetical protein
MRVRMSCPHSLDPSSCGSTGIGIHKAVITSGMTAIGAARRTKGRTGVAPYHDDGR